jgi:hypothetical protein
MNNSALTNDELKEILDRIVAFIANCDSKVSYLLSVFGVVFTILLTLKFPNLNFINITFSKLPINYWVIGVILIMVVSLLFFLKGLYHFSRVLFARIECSNYSPSKIFFGHISKYNPDYNHYLLSINNTTVEQYREDLASQIYTNSIICNKKFENYNTGFKCSIYSLPILIVSWSYLFQ